MAVILVVDDDAPIRLLLKSLLEDDLGHQVLFAVDGEAAAERFDRVDPDVVITDLFMPKMHGVALIEHLMFTYPNANILAMSGKGPEELARAVEAGAVAALKKPLDRGELLAALDRALKRAEDPWKRSRR